MFTALIFGQSCRLVALQQSFFNNRSSTIVLKKCLNAFSRLHNGASLAAFKEAAANKMPPFWDKTARRNISGTPNLESCLPGRFFALFLFTPLFTLFFPTQVAPSQRKDLFLPCLVSELRRKSKSKNDKKQQENAVN